LKLAKNKLQAQTTERHIMAKTYKILVNDGKDSQVQALRVEQGVGDKGMPARMVAKEGWRIEFQDELKAKGLAADQVRLKRVGKNLLVFFDHSQRADLLIEDFYVEGTDQARGQPKLVGMAENGNVYEYVPQDPALSSLPAALKDGNTPVIVSLGGAPMEAAFALSGLPLVAAAGGISGWALAGGVLAAAAIGGGGGGGGGGGDAPSVPPAKGTGALASESDIGYSNTDGITSNKTPYYAGKTGVKFQDVSITVDGQTYQGTSNADGVYKIQITKPLKDGVYTPSITVKDAATGLTTTADGNPFTIDTAGSPDANDRAEIKISSISDDTGATADFITGDNALNYEGRVTDFTVNGARVRLELKDATGLVVKTEDVAFLDTGAWSWNDQATPRDDGKYTLVATLVDEAGNAILGAKTTTSQMVLISASGPQVANDSATVVENNTKPATGNVLTNDHTFDDSLITKKTLATSITGKYGTLTLQESGDYTYVLDNDNAMVDVLRGASNALSAQVLTDEVFTYTVTDLTGKHQQATLSIVIEGANDAARLVSASSDILRMTDVDNDDQRFNILPSSATKYTSSYGGYFEYQTLEVGNTANEFKGTFAHTSNSNPVTLSNTTVHELFTVTSFDGSASHTFDAMTTVGSGDTNVYFGVTGNRDALVLNFAGTLDLTGNAMDSVEKVDMIGAAASTVKLDWFSLMQADAESGLPHRLYINGNADDVVQIDHAAIAPDSASVPGYHRYVFGNDAELLISQVVSLTI
jgi:VCBS repeat-containing protein